MATEMEIMQHAKRYLDKLANGINPLTDEALPETDIVNNVRISRCLFYVSDVLRQVIDKGGVSKPKKPLLPPFSITEEQLHQYELFPQPIHVTAITDRINALIEPEHMKKLSYKSIYAFLEQEGLLTTYEDNQGKTKREPTETGRAAGISTEDRVGLRGPYTVVLYDQDMQRFILENMDQIAALQQAKSGTAGPPPQPARETIDPETGEILPAEG